MHYMETETQPLSLLTYQDQLFLVQVTSAGEIPSSIAKFNQEESGGKQK